MVVAAPYKGSGGAIEMERGSGKADTKFDKYRGKPINREINIEVDQQNR